MNRLALRQSVLLCFLSFAASSMDAAELLPLAMGNEWTYRMFAYTESGEVRGEVTFQTAVRGVYDLPTSRIYHVVSNGYGRWLHIGKAGAVATELTWSSPTSVPQVSAQQVLYKYPVDSGETYLVSVGSDREAPERVIVSSVREPVETPAGGFTCIVYEVQDAATGNLKRTVYVSLGTGVVKQVNFDFTHGTLLSIQVLTRFENRVTTTERE